MLEVLCGKIESIETQLNFFFAAINDDSIKNTLKLIDPKLKSRQDLASKIALLDALKELEVTQEETSKSLSSKYRDLITNEKSLRAEYESLPSYLDRLYGICCYLKTVLCVNMYFCVLGIITDLYVDYFKLKAINVKSKVPKLIEILDHYNFDRLITFFIPSVSNDNSVMS